MTATTAASGTAPLRARLAALSAPALVAAAACAGCLIVQMANPTAPGNVLPPCPTKALLGIDCPGCGSLRMIYSVMHANFDAALRYNAVGLLALPLFVWSWGAWTVGRWRGRPVRSWHHWRWAPLVTLVVMVLWWVMRNLPFAPFAALRV